MRFNFLVVTIAVLAAALVESQTVAPTRKPTAKPTIKPTAVPPSFCDALKVPACEDPRPRDLLFLVDASNSMDRAKFYKEMLDYTKALFCAFNPAGTNQAGMILFAGQIQVVVPLGVYSRTQWSDKVESVRGSESSCCSCCTPTADALRLAGQEFDARGLNPERIAFIVTDGVPVNNGNNNGNPAWRYLTPKKGYNPAVYKYVNVVEEARKLKQKGIRVFLVGVPSSTGRPPAMLYFKGIADPADRDPKNKNKPNRQCVDRDGTLHCYNWTPEPIVSQPVEKNAFSSDTFDVATLLAQTVTALCFIVPTVAPTFAPTTLSPTLAPVKPYIDQIDLTLFLDRSNSMNDWSPQCKKIIGQSNGEESPSACWEVFTRFASRMANLTTNLVVGPKQDRKMGWAASYPAPAEGVQAKGLRVSLYGFACREEQTVPVVEVYGEHISSKEEFEAMIEKTRLTVRPFGGTCPGPVIERGIKNIEQTKEDNFPNQVAVLITDGVFYDIPHPQRAIKGLEAYAVTRYSVGIAVPSMGVGGYGLTKEEIQTQRAQLAAFAGGDPKRIFSLTADGFAVLQDIAEDITKTVLEQAGNSTKPIPRYTWCGFRRRAPCLFAERANYCKWKVKGATQWACRPKNQN